MPPLSELVIGPELSRAHLVFPLVNKETSSILLWQMHSETGLFYLLFFKLHRTKLSNDSKRKYTIQTTVVLADE